jgi:hypothetical protein
MVTSIMANKENMYFSNMQLLSQAENVKNF